MSYGTTELPYTAARIKGIIKTTGQITVKPAGLAGIQLDCNGATGDFTASITPANLTGNRRWILPNRDDTFAGLGAQTFTGAQTFSGSVIYTDSTNGINTGTTAGRLRISGGSPTNGAVLVLGGSTDGAIPSTGLIAVGAASTAIWDAAAFSVVLSTASTSTTTGALVVTGGVGVGGRLNVGGAVAISAASATPLLISVTQNAAAYLELTNLSNGASAQAQLRATNDAGVVSIFGVTGSGISAYGALTANSAQMYCTGAQGLVLMADNASGQIKFATGGNTARLTITAAGVVQCASALEVSSATLIKSNTTLTDGAAAAVGTLTNAPTAGNPTKWVLINDNGVIRKFPTWT